MKPVANIIRVKSPFLRGNETLGAVLLRASAVLGKHRLLRLECSPTQYVVTKNNQFGTCQGPDVPVGFRNVWLAFATQELRQLCESQTHAEQQLGVAVATSLRHRLADLDAASNALDLAVAEPGGFKDSARNRLFLRLGDHHNLVLRANHNTNPILGSGGVDWSKVTRVQIVELQEVTHG